ncbi:MAG: PDZ domain-containing protein [Deltaproteobacteria bacterium]|nr:MAG: PDZ domain-containing protein [Deltaproteobacteria bacterium]
MGLDHLEQDPQAALTWWRSSFEHRWGTLAAAALPRLHLALQQTRAPQAAPQPAPTRPTAPPPDPSLVSSNSAPPLLQHVPEPPTRRSTGRARPRADSPGVLGLRCEPEERGLRVSAVHPQGPAAGQIEPGDLLLLVDGAPLGGLTAQAAQAALASASDQLRDLDFERGGERRSVSLTAVAPSDLQPSLSAVRLLLLDQDAAYGLFGALVELGIAVEPDPDHDAVVVLQVPPAANAALRPSLQLGADRGIWEVLPRA